MFDLLKIELGYLVINFELVLVKEVIEDVFKIMKLLVKDKYSIFYICFYVY